MRHFLILIPLGILLCSCEPGEGSTEADSGLLRKRREKGEGMLPADGTNRERIAAQNSVGRVPQPRNLTGEAGDTCPVHHEKMKIREIPIVFEEHTAEGSGTANPPATAEFPFGAEKIVSAGNALLPGEPRTARVYQCASCVAASRTADLKRQQPAAPSASR